MKTFDTMKQDLFDVNGEIRDLFDAAGELPGIAHLPLDEWGNLCGSIEAQIDEGILRIAVVGAIKSGKSTFVNALLGGDYLKRGAGVVTSIVTKIRRGPALKAILDFKTWGEINGEMRQAMAFLPSFDGRSGAGQFDIRREKDRKELETALEGVSADNIILQETLDVNSLLLMSYLNGYDRVKEVISLDAGAKSFDGPEFVRHKDFVGDDSLAVYLRDLELRIPSGEELYDNIEIADCQGSDSPNPLHLSMTQEYLLRTHLVIYLLSSRTGVRQADIKFLSMIRKMGLMENIFFVVNCDFNEHESLEGLQTLVRRIEEELSVIKPDPAIFTISTLFNLLRKEADVSRRDRIKVEQWLGEKDFAKFSDRESERFESVFREKLTRDRFTLLLKNPLERFAVMMASVNDWAGVNSDILARDSKEAEAVFEKMEDARRQIKGLKPVIQDTMDGVSQKTKTEIGKEVDRVLDAHYGTVITNIQEFVRRYEPDYERIGNDLDGMGFSSALYMVFQDFKHDIDLFMAETVNPALIQFIGQQEKKIVESLDRTSGTYDALIQNTLQRYKETVRSLGISSVEYTPGALREIDREDLGRRAGLHVPPLASPLRYTARVRAEAVISLGFYNSVKMIKKLFKRQIQDKSDAGIRALKEGVKRIKQETDRSIILHLSHYKENLKYQYLFKFVDIVSTALSDDLLDRFRVFTMDISDMEGIVDKEQTDKEKILTVFRSVEKESRRILDRITGLKARMEE